MKERIRIGAFALTVLFVLALASCCKQDDYVSPLVGHWGCEQYVSCRIDSAGAEKWESFDYEVGPGCEYELFFEEDGSGKLLLNNSPAVIKKFTCNYEYDTVSKKITIRGNEWLFFLYGSFTHGENQADFDVESMTDTTFVVSWTNRFSETIPFFERFFIRRID